MNDGNCDCGRPLLGGDDGPGRPSRTAGALYRLDPDLTVYPRARDGVTESNGIDWSPDDRLMYYVDSIDRRVDVYDFDLASGSLGNRQQLITFEDTIPDGLTVDADGNLWVACWGGYARAEVLGRRCAARDRLTADGEHHLPGLRRSRARPDVHHFRAHDAVARAAEREPEAGALFVCEPGVRGRPQRIFAG